MACALIDYNAKFLLQPSLIAALYILFLSRIFMVYSLWEKAPKDFTKGIVCSKGVYCMHVYTASYSWLASYYIPIAIILYHIMASYNSHRSPDIWLAS